MHNINVQHKGVMNGPAKALVFSPLYTERLGYKVP